MSTPSLDLSGKIDAQLVAIFKLISEVAKDQGADYFVAGATARDIILCHGYGINVGRATADIDFGVNVSDWAHFERLIEGLVATKKFNRGGSTHRLIYVADGLPTPIDIVPFGGVVTSNAEIAWPPERAVIMNVLGFEEAFRAAVPIRLSANPDVCIAFSSMAGFALMKLISWNDGFTGNTNDPEKRLKKDSADLWLVMAHYLKAGNENRFFEEHVDLVEADDFDYDLASARLLGRDIRKLLDDQSLPVVLEILERETNSDMSARHRLVENILDSPLRNEVDVERCLEALTALKQGVFDKV